MTETATVLVVDDTPANVRLLEALLASWGHSMVSARDGLEALSVLRENAPDLVLLDIRMPGIDGHEVCRRIRANAALQALPVIMVTSSDIEDRVKGLEAGADDFVTRPFDRSELRARIASLLRIKRYHDTIVAQANELAEWNARLEARVEEQLAHIQRLVRLRRFLSPQVAEAVLASRDESLLASHRREIAVVFVELRGVGALAGAEPEEVVEVIRDYQAAVGGRLRVFDATIGPLAAERVMAYLNDPLPCPDPAAAAVRMAVAIRGRVEENLEAWSRRGWALSCAIGTASGYATMGTIGFEDRYEYGPVGAVVGLASGLCEQARGGQVLIDQRTYAAVEHLVSVECLPPLSLRGLAGPVPAFAVQDLTADADHVEPAEATAEVRRLGLTEREVEVLTHLAAGLTNRQIARALYISEKTASVHVSHILTKLGVTTRGQAAAVAHRLGMPTAAG